MTREECERIIADKMIEIVDAYLKYNPEGEYLHLSFGRMKNGDGNDNGSWDIYHFDANNSYFKDDTDRPINIDATKHIKDSNYWECVTEEEDREEDEHEREQGTLLPSGWNIWSRKF